MCRALTQHDASSSRLALSAVGQQQDVDTLTAGYEERWWLEQLARRNLSAVWLRSQYPHNYEVTALEAYMDLYQITGERRYLDAVDGFVALFRQHWLMVGGSVAIKEWRLCVSNSLLSSCVERGSSTESVLL